MNGQDGIGILIVEDEIITAMLMQRRLQDFNAGFCGIAASGEEAITIAENKKPDIILMDIRLSGLIDGIETAERILKLISSKIIFITGYNDEQIRNRAAKVNPVAFLSKPVNFDSLKRIITDEISR